MINWAYIAGFIDGDGWITTYKNKYSKPIVGVIGICQKSDKYKKMLNIVNFFDKESIKYCLIKINQKPTKLVSIPIEMIRIIIKERKSILKVCQKLIPFINIKKTQLIKLKNITQNRLIERKNNYNKINLILIQSKKKYWTNKEDNIIKNLIKQGRSNIFIAKKLNRSINSVSHRIYRNYKRKKGILIY